MLKSLPFFIRIYSNLRNRSTKFSFLIPIYEILGAIQQIKITITYITVIGIIGYENCAYGAICRNIIKEIYVMPFPIINEQIMVIIAYPIPSNTNIDFICFLLMPMLSKIVNSCLRVIIPTEITLIKLKIPIKPKINEIPPDRKSVV